MLILLLALTLLWHGNENSMQAAPAMVAGVYFDGEYRIADGEWQKIVKGNHISSTEGDVTLRGNFYMLAPDGEYVGIYTDSIPIAKSYFVPDMRNMQFPHLSCMPPDT